MVNNARDAGADRPSTDWQERIAPDEAARYARYAEIFADIQRRKSARHGTGRALHRKQLVAAQGRLEVLGGLPEFARQGLFAQPGEHRAWVRLSNGGMDKARDRVPDIRGLAIKVWEVEGPDALGLGPARSQDFLLINQEQFAFPGSDEFVGLVAAVSQGPGRLLAYLARRYGLVGATRRVAQLARTAGKPFAGFANETLFSAVPIACGPYAVRVRLLPSANNGAPNPQAREDWGRDFSARLARQPLYYELQLQPFVNERLTPIEDASVNWPTPYTTVARLELPRQDTASADGQALQEQAEKSVFDPWQALAAHRPLGDVQRARKVVYYQSQQGRGAAG